MSALRASVEPSRKLLILKRIVENYL